MLKALRARTGWRRALALALLFAFTAGVLHVHGPSVVHADTVIADAGHDDGHDHGDDDTSVPSASSDCSYCAVVVGKFYVPVDIASATPVLSVRIAFNALATEPPVSRISDLFRPPIALA